MFDGLDAVLKFYGIATFAAGVVTAWLVLPLIGRLFSHVSLVIS